MGWTDERVELLKTLWQGGLSASQVAKQLGGVTRNAVIGKVHRLGLSGRATPSAPCRLIPRAARPARIPRARPPRRAVHAVAPRPAHRLVEEAPGTATALSLGAHMCKWPIGDPRQESFTFCGDRAEDGPYCFRHIQVAFRPGAGKGSGEALARSLRRYIG